MTSTIKVNNVQNQCGQNIINENSNTITIGASGDTIALASGASQTGFGRTGTVDWQTGDIKTTTFTAANGKGYFVNTTSGAITANLPSSPSAGDIVAFADYAGTAANNKITIGRGGSNIEGVAQDGEINANRDTITLVYVDGTQGWVAVNDNESSFLTPKFVTATGGNTTVTCGDFKYHKFTGPGTFCVSCAGNPVGADTVQVLVIAGGGGTSGNASGGGGAGGLRNVACTSVTVQGYPITVGGGGTGDNSPNPPGITNGTNSTAIGLTSAGGGRGGLATCLPPAPVNRAGADGGSGGGGTGNNRCSAAGSGNVPSVAPPQGNPGGTTSPSSPNVYRGAGGGGGAGGAAPPKAGPAASPGPPAGNGGEGGAALDVTPSFPSPAGGGTFAGGGGGGVSRDGPNGPSSSGGSVTGGAGAAGGPGSPGSSGTANTGSGGGGGGTCNQGGGAGGSGLVIIKYRFQT